MLELIKSEMRPSGKPDRKTRLHVSMPTESEKRICQQPEWGVSQENEKEWADWRKVQVAAQKEVLVACVLPLLGTGVKANFSQKAGCSCGCSPGFILTGHTGMDIWLDLK